LLAAWTMSSTGDGVRAAALPLYTAVSTHSPLAVSAVAVAEVLPWLLVALPAGALVDRWRNRMTLLAAHGSRGLLTALLAVAILTKTAGFPALLLGAFLLTSAETFADAASQSLLVDLAGEADLERANGRFVSRQTIGMEIAGPLVVAALFVVHPAACFAADALAFGLAAGLVVTIPPRSASPRAPAAEPQTLVTEALTGLKFLWTNAALRIVVGVVGWTALLVSAVNAVATLYAIEVMRLPAAIVPTLMVAAALGTVIATRVVTWLVTFLSGGVIMISSLAVLTAGIAGLGLAGRPVTAWGAYFVIGFGAGAWNVLSAVKRQRLTPESMMGRLASAYRVCAWGLMPLGAGIAGPLAALTSLRTVLIGAAVLIGVMVVLAAPSLRKL
jgi:MFS family permease